LIEDYSQLLRPVYELAEQAGQAIVKLYNKDNANVNLKADNTPVTEADLVANRIIVEGLKKLTPNTPILSEEFAEVAFSERESWQQYWLIDPLDGTKEYIERTDEFTVNIALIDQHEPVLGVVLAPVKGIGYEACRGCGAFKRGTQGMYHFIQTRTRPEELLTITISRRHGKRATELLQRFGDYEVLHRGSALKICLVAEGVADIYPRLGPTSEWDTAAGQCILEEAGGRLMDFQGQEIRYNTKASTLNPEFMAVGDYSYDWLALLNEVQ
jgi:3'(2'), 5'-bisphosphate nucleotidase